MTPKQLMKLPAGRYRLKDHRLDYTLEVFLMGARNDRCYRLICNKNGALMSFRESINNYDYDFCRAELYVIVLVGNVCLTKTITRQLSELEFKGNGSFKEFCRKTVK